MVFPFHDHHSATLASYIKSFFQCRGISTGSMLDDDRWSFGTTDRWSESGSTGNPDSVSIYSRMSGSSENVSQLP